MEDNEMRCVLLQHPKRVVLVLVLHKRVVSSFSIFLQVYLVVVLLLTFELPTCVHSQGMFQHIPREIYALDKELHHTVC